MGVTKQVEINPNAPRVKVSIPEPIEENWGRTTTDLLITIIEALNNAVKKSGDQSVTGKLDWSSLQRFIKRPVVNRFEDDVDKPIALLEEIPTEFADSVGRDYGVTATEIPDEARDEANKSTKAFLFRTIEDGIGLESVNTNGLLDFPAYFFSEGTEGNVVLREGVIESVPISDVGEFENNPDLSDEIEGTIYWSKSLKRVVFYRDKNKEDVYLGYALKIIDNRETEGIDVSTYNLRLSLVATECFEIVQKVIEKRIEEKIDENKTETDEKIDENKTETDEKIDGLEKSLDRTALFSKREASMVIGFENYKEYLENPENPIPISDLDRTTMLSITLNKQLETKNITEGTTKIYDVGELVLSSLEKADIEEGAKVTLDFDVEVSNTGGTPTILLREFNGDDLVSEKNVENNEKTSFSYMITNNLTRFEGYATTTEPTTINVLGFDGIYTSKKQIKSLMVWLKGGGSAGKFNSSGSFSAGNRYLKG